MAAFLWSESMAAPFGGLQCQFQILQPNARNLYRRRDQPIKRVGIVPEVADERSPDGEGLPAIAEIAQKTHQPKLSAMLFIGDARIQRLVRGNGVEQ